MKKNILITGTSKGLGKFLKENLKNNYEVIGISREDSEINFDLKDFSKYDEILEKIGDKKIGTIILNAGVGYFGDFETGENYEEIIKLNLLSPIIFLQKILPFLDKKAEIIFIGSIISKKFMKGACVYQASKFGLRGFAGGLKNELKGKKVFIINPKILETNFHNNSKIFIPNDKEKITELQDILDVILNILDKKEKRFEIDL